MKGFGTDEKTLINILSTVPDPITMAAIRRDYMTKFHRNLIEDVKEECNGKFEEALVAVIRGPLAQDCFILHGAL